MKKGKVISFVTAAVMAMASLPVLAASAESAYQLGDVDMDGVITGHDTAMVSRALYDASFTLTNEQIKLADMDGNGVVDQADLEQLHASEVYMIGDVQNYGRLELMDAWYALMVDSMARLGTPVTVDNSSTMLTNKSALEAELLNEYKMNQVSYHLLDADANGTVDVYDAMELMIAFSWQSLGESPYFAEGRYDLFRSYFSVDRTDFDGKDYACRFQPIEVK